VSMCCLWCGIRHRHIPLVYNNNHQHRSYPQGIHNTCLKFHRRHLCRERIHQSSHDRHHTKCHSNSTIHRLGRKSTQGNQL
jgi:hypothetical protein